MLKSFGIRIFKLILLTRPLIKAWLDPVYQHSVCRGVTGPGDVKQTPCAQECHRKDAVGTQDRANSAQAVLLQLGCTLESPGDI